MGKKKSVSWFSEHSDPAKSAGLVTLCLITSRMWKTSFQSEGTFSVISGGIFGCSLILLFRKVQQKRHSSEVALKTLNEEVRWVEEQRKALAHVGGLYVSMKLSNSSFAFTVLIIHCWKCLRTPAEQIRKLQLRYQQHRWWCKQHMQNKISGNWQRVMV